MIFTRIITQTIQFPSNGGFTPGYLVNPDDGDEHLAVVLIQEFWGLVPHIKDVAERFARQGFIALAPDLYHGKAAAEPDEARKLAMELDRPRAIREIGAAADYLTRLDSVSPKKIGIVGWCMGGSLALSAAHLPNTGAVVAFYGMPQNLDFLQGAKAPILGLYGEQDHGIPLEKVNHLDQELDKLPIPHEIHIYPGAGHAFFNDSRHSAYQPEAAKDAWERTLQWFHKHLTGEQVNTRRTKKD
jgi:carboxymethylenebutenolidase